LRDKALLADLWASGAAPWKVWETEETSAVPLAHAG
jgi:hypothetical protein